MEASRTVLFVRVVAGAGPVVELERTFQSDAALDEVVTWLAGGVGGGSNSSCAAAAASFRSASGEWEVVDETQYPARALALDLGKTLHSHGLWPSARLIVQRAPRLALRVCTARPADGVASFRLRPDEAVSTVAARAVAALPGAFDGQVRAIEAPKCRLILGGRVLRGDVKLNDVEGLEDGALLVLAPPPPASRAAALGPRPTRENAPHVVPSINGSSSSNADASSQPTAAGAEPPMCRICLSTETEADDHLFSPCLCRGSMAHVHAACLDEWRRAAPGRSRFRCDQCLYTYRVQRSLWGRFLLSDTGALSVVAAALAAAVYTNGLIGYRCLHPAARGALYKSLRFARAPATVHGEVVAIGIAGCGFSCFIIYAASELFKAYILRAHLGVDWRQALEPTLLLGLWVCAEAIEIKRARAFAVIGFALCAKGTFHVTLDLGRRVAHTLGERVLEVNH